MSNPLLRLASAVFLFALVSAGLFVAQVAQARMHQVKPGHMPELEPGEGLVVVAVDTSVNLASVRVRKGGEFFGAGVMKELERGRSLRLYAVPAGKYTWAQIKPYTWFYYDLTDKPEFGFTVEAGKITYAGDLLFRPLTRYEGTIQVSNRGLSAIDWLQKEHPALYRQYPFVFTGHYPDPFPQFYRDVTAKLATAPATDAVLTPPPKPGSLPLPVRTLWKENRVLSARMNAKGDLVVVHVRTEDKRWNVELVDLVAGTATKLASSNAEFGNVMWSGDSAVLMPVSEDGPEDIFVARISVDAGGKRAITRMRLPRKGVVVDAVLDDPDHILFASLGSRDELLVHRMDIGSQQALDNFRYNVRDRLNIGVTDDLSWFTDGRGRLRLALATRDEKTSEKKAGEGEAEGKRKRVLMYGMDGRFTEVMQIEDEDPFIPTGLSADGALIYGITDKDRAQRELVVFDPAQGKITRTLFSRSGVDVVSTILDARHEVAGVRYYEGGRLVSEYFDAAANDQAALLRKSFPGKTVVVGGRSVDGKQLLLWVDAGDQPAQLYHMDVTARRASLLDETMPWIEPGQLAPSEAFTFKGVDGTPLEAFLTLPSLPGKRPLIVFPHGGPIGVSDKLHFDPEVQFLASLGYAVLRVNYRGSEGYGKAFREAGYRKYGTAIEDDIDAATRYAWAHYPVDSTRMCAVGSSYGGYSSLVSAIRWPDRFRCVVSVSGVSDRILFFTASDAGNDKDTRKAAEKLIGDPHTQLEEMKQTSPLYHYQDLKVPVMLVHGKEDLRVDYEHARRLQRMLEIDGRPPVGLVFDKEGHGVNKIDNVETMWNGIAGFLQSYLGPAPVAAPASAPAASAP